MLYRFTGGTDGAFPMGSLIFDAEGKNLYGVTQMGGGGACVIGCGTVFRLEPNLDGSWTESIIHTFDNRSGAGPNAAGPASDVSGNLYGTTQGGGSKNCAGGCGTVFRLKPNADRSWAYAVLSLSFFSSRRESACHSAHASWHSQWRSRPCVVFAPILNSVVLCRKELALCGKKDIAL